MSFAAAASAILDFVDNDGNGANPAQLSRRYLHGPAVDQVLAEEDTSAVFGTPSRVLWHLGDQLGSTRDLVDNTGTLATHYKLDSFGNIKSGDTSKTRYIFTNQEYDPDTGLYYFNARWYDPNIGRFLSEDPNPAGTFADGANNVAYVHNGPTNFTDPTGLWRYRPELGRLKVFLGPVKEGFKVDFRLDWKPNEPRHRSKYCPRLIAVNFVQMAFVHISGVTAFHKLNPWHVPFDTWFNDTSEGQEPYYNRFDTEVNLDNPVRPFPHMDDEPGIDGLAGALSHVSFSFMTAVVVTEPSIENAVDRGDVLGVVKWGFSYDVERTLLPRVSSQNLYVNDVTWGDRQQQTFTVEDDAGTHDITIGGPPKRPGNIGDYSSYISSVEPSGALADELSAWFGRY